MRCASTHGSCASLLSGVLPVLAPSLDISSRTPWQSMRLTEKTSPLGRKSRVRRRKRKRSKKRAKSNKRQKNNNPQESLCLYSMAAESCFIVTLEVGTSRKSACEHPELDSGVNAWLAWPGNSPLPGPEPTVVALRRDRPSARQSWETLPGPVSVINLCNFCPNLIHTTAVWASGLSLSRPRNLSTHSPPAMQVTLPRTTQRRR